MIKNFYPFNSLNKVLEEENKVVVQQPMGWICGYVALLKKDIPEKWHGNYNADALQYLNIHGGITFCKVEGNYVVFGFDCAHAYDENNAKLQDANYVMELVKQMEQQILTYAKQYKKWKSFKTKKGRINFIQNIIESAKIKEKIGTGAMLDALLGGEAFK